MKPSSQRQVNVYFSGRVQGVGFRFTTRDIASRFAVTGFVRNLADGRVELVAEGDQDELDSFLDAVRIRFAQHIRDEKRDSQPATGEYAEFEIRH